MDQDARALSEMATILWWLIKIFFGLFAFILLVKMTNYLRDIKKILGKEQPNPARRTSSLLDK